MTIVEQIKDLKSRLSSARSNSEYNKMEKQIMKLAKMHNKQNHRERYFIYNGTVYGLENNPNHLMD